MSTLTLPARPDRPWLVSFSLAASLLGGLIAAGLWIWLGALRMAFVALGIGLLCAVAGAIRPQLFRAPYRLSNRVAVAYARWARVAVLWVCYYTVFLAVGRAGSALRLHPPVREASNWHARGRRVGPEDHAGRALAAESGPVRQALSWGLRSGQIWVISLAPFLTLLRVLEPAADGRSSAEDADLPSGIYTLY